MPVVIILKPTRVLLILLLSSLVLGCEGAGDVVKMVEERHKSLSDYSASVEVINSMTGHSYTADFWVKGEKQKVIYTSPAKISGSIFVNNGSCVWYYSPSENRAIYAKPTDVTINFDYGKLFRSIVQNSTTEVEKHGDGYIIKATQNNNVTIEINVTRDYYPSEIRWLLNGTEVIKIAYFNFTFNTGIKDDFFEFIPPENATVSSIEDLNQRVVVFKSIKEAEDSAGFEACIPNYTPANFNLTISVLKPLNILVLTYSNSTDLLEIKERVGNPVKIEGAEEITIGNKTTHFLDAGYARIISWKQGELDITITTTLDKTELMRVVELFKCE